MAFGRISMSLGGHTSKNNNTSNLPAVHLGHLSTKDPRMKHLYVLSIVLIALLTGCSEIPENNDPVIGIWAQTQAPKDPVAKYVEREEWIFNDAYLGRYHVYQGSELVIQTDFQWNSTGSFYTIEYPGLEKTADQVRIEDSQDGTALIDQKGTVMAFRE
jgi:outer membrane biogenesis lipoprotein LolB